MHACTAAGTTAIRMLLRYMFSFSYTSLHTRKLAFPRGLLSLPSHRVPALFPLHACQCLSIFPSELNLDKQTPLLTYLRALWYRKSLDRPRFEHHMRRSLARRPAAGHNTARSRSLPDAPPAYHHSVLLGPACSRHRLSCNVVRRTPGNKG